MDCIGLTVSAGCLGKKGNRIYTFQKCESCGNERWVLLHRFASGIGKICPKCACRLIVVSENFVRGRKRYLETLRSRKKEQAKCGFCGKEFQKRNSLSKYCSVECFNKRNVKANTVRCSVCGVKYVRKWMGQKTCSWKCGNKLKELRGKKARCKTCGAEIKQKRPTTKYCSYKCQFNRNGVITKNICVNCGNEFNVYPSRKRQKFCSRKCQGAWSSANLSGENSWKWVGGEDRTFRDSQEYRRWRKAVIERDEKTCQMCGEFNFEIQAHHIKPATEFRELRLDVSNGIALCKECHSSIRGRESEFESIFIKRAELNSKNA